MDFYLETCNTPRIHLGAATAAAIQGMEIIALFQATHADREFADGLRAQQYFLMTELKS